jgi:hypothetical protein
MAVSDEINDTNLGAKQMVNYPKTDLRTLKFGFEDS